MEDGTISGNTAISGAGVLNGATFEMSGGTITGNTAYQNNENSHGAGGGVVNNGDMVLSGGSITANNAHDGGIYAQALGTLSISGGSVTGNTADTAANIMLMTDGFITITDVLPAESRFGVAIIDSLGEPIEGVFTSGLSGKGSADNFVNENGAGFEMSINGDGEAQYTASAAASSTTWDGTIPSSAPSGYDETADPITLDTVDEFVWFFKRVGAGTSFNGKTVVLTTDIDLSGYNFGTVWTTPGNYFSGIFDGQNHTVSNFTFSSGNKAYRWSLFRNVKNATIKNLQLDNVNVGTGTGTGHAALVGMTQGDVTIENVHINSGSVSGATAVGGVVGQNKAAELTIRNCSNAASITATTQYAGGIVGASTSDSNENTAILVENCVNTGAVTTARGGAAGIYGAIEPDTATPSVVFKDCANEGTLTATNGVTGEIYTSSTVSVTVKTTASDAVIALISAIDDPVVYTDECKAKIDAAREAYNALTIDQKDYVSNYSTLTAAEAAYAALAPAPLTYNGITFQPWTATDSLPTSGNWYLTGNVTPGNHCIINDASAPLSLLLNGQTIDLSNGVVIGLWNGATFNLYDEDNTGVITGGTGSGGYGAAIYGQNGTFNMYGGTITGCSASNGGGAVLLMNTSAFNMYGGVITGNYGGYGGGVDIYSGTFTMYDGTLSNNTGYYGGGILVDQNGTFVMNGGTITGNTGYYYGGGISSYGTVRITGNCPITYNTAGYGGGGIELENGGKLYMNGGVVSFNRVSNQNGDMYKGGGLHVPNGSECHLQGNVQITNNYQGSNGETPNNMFVRTEALGKVFLDAQLTDGASIGVGTNAQAGGTFTGSENTNYNDAGKFTSDSASYIIGKNAAGQLLLGAPCTVTFVDGNGTELQSGQIAYGAACVYNGKTPVKADDAQYTYTFSGWTDGENSYGLSETLPAVTGNVTYKATYTTSPSPLATAKADAKDALDNYKNADDYRDAQKTELANAIAAGKDAIDAAADTDAVATALANAKAAIDAIKTDAQLTAEENQAAADDVIAKINAIGTVEYTAESKALIDAAKEAYDALTDDQKTLVTNAAALTDAETAYTAKEAEYGEDWQSVTIDDQISINFILNTAKHAGLKSITINYVNQDKEVTNTVYVDVNEIGEPVNGFYKIPAVVAPAQIGDTITVTVVDENGTTTLRTSIKDYCEYLLDGNFEQKYKDLAKATLEYGQAANDYFAGTGFYDAANITTITDALNTANVGLAQGTEQNLSVNANGKINGISFMVLTQPVFRFYVSSDCTLTEADFAALNDGKITVKINGEITKDVTAQFVKNTDKEGAIMLEVKGIDAAHMDDVITITIDNGDFGTITFSGNDFARLLAGNEATQTLGTALYLYGVKAKDCFKPEV